jgi:hypothetical protein
VLGDARIARILGTVNRQALHLITCTHHKTLNLIVWAVPTGTHTHKQTLLKFNYVLNRWLPPDTGFEYRSLAAHTTTAGEYGLYVGDEWGRVYKLWMGEIDGAPGGTLQATVTSATSSTVTCSGATFYTTGSGLAGMPVLVVSPTGGEQWVRVSSNTATTLTLDIYFSSPFSPIPLAGSTVHVGAINFYWWTPRFTGGDPFTKKAPGWLYLQGATGAQSTPIHVDVRFDHQLAIEHRYSFYFAAGGLVWGAGFWGAPWGAAGDRIAQKRRMPRAFFDCSIRISNYHPNQPVEVTALRVNADWLRRRKARSS